MANRTKRDQGQGQVFNLASPLRHGGMQLAQPSQNFSPAASSGGPGPRVVGPSTSASHLTHVRQNAGRNGYITVYHQCLKSEGKPVHQKLGMGCDVFPEHMSMLGKSSLQLYSGLVAKCIFLNAAELHEKVLEVVNENWVKHCSEPMKLYVSHMLLPYCGLLIEVAVGRKLSFGRRAISTFPRSAYP